MKAVQNKYYRWGNRVGSLLANLTRPANSRSPIFSVKDQITLILTNTDQIKTAFYEYFEDLYRAEPKDASAMDSFLRTIHTPEVSEEQKDLLEGEITAEEVNMKVKKSAHAIITKPQDRTAYRQNIIIFYHVLLNY